MEYRWQVGDGTKTRYFNCIPYFFHIWNTSAIVPTPPELQYGILQTRGRWHRRSKVALSTVFLQTTLRQRARFKCNEEGHLTRDCWRPRLRHGHCLASRWRSSSPIEGPQCQLPCGVGSDSTTLVHYLSMEKPMFVLSIYTHHRICLDHNHRCSIFFPYVLTRS